MFLSHGCVVKFDGIGLLDALQLLDFVHFARR